MSEEDRAELFIPLLASHDRRLAAFVRTFEKDADQREGRIVRLADCIAKLSPQHRQLLPLRCGEELVSFLNSDTQKSVTLIATPTPS